jgi:heme-degrading monooxygenase HmoA
MEVTMVRFLNCFEVAVGREDEFLRLWQEVNDYMVDKPGYLGHQLHRSLADEARYRFINCAEWESVQHWREAHDEGFRALALRPEMQPFATTPALYEVVHAGGRLS